jgi:hypothetical protein
MNVITEQASKRKSKQTHKIPGLIQEKKDLFSARKHGKVPRLIVTTLGGVSRGRGRDKPRLDSKASTRVRAGGDIGNARTDA